MFIDSVLGNFYSSGKAIIDLIAKSVGIPFIAYHFGIARELSQSRINFLIIIACTAEHDNNRPWSQIIEKRTQLRFKA